MRQLVCVVMCVLGAALAGCAAKGAEPVDDDVATTLERPSFEAFRADVVQDEEGVFIYDGDLTAQDEAGLRRLYEELFPAEGALIVQNVGGSDRIWSATQKHQLTYCVSRTFGTRHAAVVAAMAEATDDWMMAADVSFQYLSEEDDNCTASNPRVLFDIRPTSTTSYLARAFFPGYSRSQRNILVSTTAFSSRTPLVGVIRHELGHVLGFLHEHIRRPSTPCPEGGSYRGVTAYDPGSVMHYPQCGGTNFRLDLSPLDVTGAAAVYGDPVSATPEPPPPPPPAGTARTGSASSSVSRGAEVPFQPLTVLEGSDFSVQMTGTGDADLYVRFGAAPTTSAYHCRPYAGDSNERCDLTVPAGESQAYIMVRGYTAASFRIDVSWVQP